MTNRIRIPPTEIEVTEAINYLDFDYKDYPKCRDVIRRLAYQRDMLVPVLFAANSMRMYCTIGSSASQNEAIRTFDNAVASLGSKRDKADQ